VESHQKKTLKNKQSYPPLKKSNGSWAVDDQERVETFKNHLSEVFKPYDNINNPAFSNEIENFLLFPLQMTLPPKAFFPAEVQHCILFFLKKKKITWIRPHNI